MRQREDPRIGDPDFNTFNYKKLIDPENINNLAIKNFDGQNL